MSGESTELRQLPRPDMSNACVGCVALCGFDGERTVDRVAYTEDAITVSVTDHMGSRAGVAIAEPNPWSGERYDVRTAEANTRMRYCKHHAMDDRFMPTPDCPAGLRAEPAMRTRRKPSPRPR